MYTALWKHTHGMVRALFIVPPTPFAEWHLLWKGFPSQQECFHSFLAFSQNTEDQVHLGSVIQGRHRYYPTPHTPLVPHGESSLTGQKGPCDAVAQVLRHTAKLCVSKTGQAVKPTGFIHLYFFIPHAQRN